MSERTTGATPEQVEAAAKRMIAAWWVGSRWDTGSEDVAGDQSRSWARFLVPPDERIVAAADLRAVLELVPIAIQLAPMSEHYVDGEQAEAAAARLREVLGDA